MNDAAPPVPPPRRDFPDWLSPMLVKELRQGMRTRVFVFSFVLLQILMTLNVVIGLLSTAQGQNPGATNFVFWLMVGLPVLLILPMSGLGALSSERSANTLELLFLTRLSAWRIVFGKWFAIVAQIALFTCAVLPYLVLRYFMGGVNLSENLGSLLLMLAAAAVLTAITVGVSPFQTRSMRVISIIAVIFLLQFGGSMLLFLVADRGVVRGGTSAGEGWKMTVALLLFGAMLVVLMLQIAAGKIAPAAENHSGVKRLLGVGFLLLAAVLLAIGAHPARTLIVACVCCAPVLIGAVCDPLRANFGVYRPFLRRGLAGRLAGRLFYPGWPTGVPLALLLLLGFGALLNLEGLLDTARARLIYVGAVGALLFPAALTRLFWPRTDHPHAFYAGTWAVAIVVTIMVSILDNIFDLTMRIPLCAFPPSAFLESALAVIGNDADAARALPLAAAGTLVGAVVLLIRLLPEWKRLGALEREIAASPDEPLA